MTRRALLPAVAFALAGSLAGASPQAAATSTSPSGQSRPNILLIVADDVGFWNVGAYSHGMMVPTPSLDRIAREGMLFTDHYAQPTCTPGRAALITGQLPIRTGLTTVGMAGSPPPSGRGRPRTRRWCELPSRTAPVADPAIPRLRLPPECAFQEPAEGPGWCAGPA